MRKNLLSSFRAALRRISRRSRSVPRRRAESLPVSRAAIEQLVGGAVNDLALFEQALKHRSLLRGQPQSHLRSNERLEFLGDAVLGFVVAEYLYRHFPTKTEGFMTRLRAKLVNGDALARYAEEINLGSCILMSKNMVQSEGRKNQTILADAFEAVIGALYLDQGLEPTRRFIHRTMLDQVDLEALAQRYDNYKSLLLEHVQAQGRPQPQYRVVKEEGPSHDKVFTVEVLLSEEVYGGGRAKSKKRAEQLAALKALQRLRVEEEDDDSEDEDLEEVDLEEED